MELRRHPYSDLIRKTSAFAALSVTLFSGIYFVLALVLDGRWSVASISVFVCAIAAHGIVLFVTYLCDKKSAKSILFQKDSVRYGYRYIDLQEASLRYFRFYLSVFDPALEFPKLCINTDGSSLVCYLSQRDMKKLKAMGYPISEI